MEYFVQQIMNAFAFGAEYALLALGLAIVFSIMGLVNFAHGEMIAVGGYTMVAAAALAAAAALLSAELPHTVALAAGSPVASELAAVMPQAAALAALASAAAQ